MECGDVEHNSHEDEELAETNLVGAVDDLQSKIATSMPQMKGAEIPAEAIVKVHRPLQ